MRCGDTHLTREERYHIELEHARGIPIRRIAERLHRSPSTVSRELRRNANVRGYCHERACELARERRRTKPKRVKVTPDMAERIDDGLSQHWSPEQICGRMRLEGIPIVSRQTIYRRIWKDRADGGGQHHRLRHGGRPRKRKGCAEYRGRIPDRTDISERPAVVEERSRLGDWEADTIIGKGHRGALVTSVERKTRYILACTVKRKTKQETAEAMLRMLTPLASAVQTVTYDNGREFCDHAKVSDALECSGYFATPYKSCERGTSENSNGLLRQYFPKSMRLDQVTPEQVQEATDRLNSRPRKCLGFMTPEEALNRAIMN